MKIVADENIPFIQNYFSGAGELIVKSGRSICNHDVLDADILLVRSVTKVNEELLQHSRVKFVGSSTTGFDHLDIAYLNANNIAWSVATGCNRTAVIEYVLSVVAWLQKNNYLCMPAPRAAVIGVGGIGCEVAAKLKVLGFEVLECDPLRALNEKDFSGVSLEDIHDVDFISLHTPLTRSGAFPTFHLIGKNFLQRQKPGCILLNAGRGAAIDFADLKREGNHLLWCLDVWENEPDIDHDILKQALIATPHIAGYSLQSKIRGIDMIYHVLLQQHIISESTALPPYPQETMRLPESAFSWRDICLTLFDPMQKTLQMKDALLNGSPTFDDLRKQSNDRFESAYVKFENIHFNPAEAQRLKQLMI